jgi:hypothetical protein
VKQIRWTAKASLSRYQPQVFGANHEWKIGAQFDRGEHRALAAIPTGTRYIYSNNVLSRTISSDPNNPGGRFNTISAFATDAVTLGNRLTVDAGLRFGHSDAISQDVHALGYDGRETGVVIAGLGRLYTWKVFSPRLGGTVKLTGDGRTVLRGSYGRFSQGVLTGEVTSKHPGLSVMIRGPCGRRLQQIAAGTCASVLGKPEVVVARHFRAPRNCRQRNRPDHGAAREVVTLKRIAGDDHHVTPWRPCVQLGVQAPGLVQILLGDDLHLHAGAEHEMMVLAGDREEVL